MNHLCSIIISVYNEENNIEKCFEVIQNQTYKAIEAIFINDGSTDNSENTILQIAAKYPDLKTRLVNQENQGAASARRNGVMHASGNFIAILDCDDELSENAISEAMKCFEKDVDIVLFDLKYKKTEDDRVILKDFQYFTKDRFVGGREALRSSLDSWGLHGLGVFRKNLFLEAINIYNQHNNDNYINNDEVITRVSFLLSDRIGLSKGIYYYNFNVNSTTKRLNENIYKTNFNAIILYRILSDKPEFEFSPDFLIAYFWGNLNYFLKNKSDLLNKSEWMSSFEQMLNFINESNVFSKLSFKRKLQLLLIRILRKLL